MPLRPRVTKLPPQIRRELDERLRAANYGDYVALSDWLQSQGYSISKSALQVYGKEQETLQPRGVSRRDALLLELGEIRLREHAIVQELMTLD